MADNKILSKRLELNEKMDCTVLTISQAFDISYESAHNLCKAHGRQDQQGFNVQARLLGNLKNWLEIQIDFNNLRLRDFLKILSRIEESKQLTWIILVPGHMLCVKHGKRLDGGTNDNVKIERCFLVRKPNES